MSSNKPLVPTTENMVKEGINDMETKSILLQKSITRHKEKNKVDTVNETDKPQASKRERDKSIDNESKKVMVLDKSRSLDKLRSSQRTETEDTVKKLNKSRPISLASLSDKSIKIEKPKEINVISYSPIVSSISGHRASIMTVLPDK